MAIINITSSWRRRAVLVIGAPIVLPAQALLIAVFAVWDDIRTWPALVRNVWNGGHV